MTRNRNTQITNETSRNSERDYYRSPKYLTKKLLYPEYVDNIIDDLPENATVLEIGHALYRLNGNKDAKLLALSNEQDENPLLHIIGE